MRLAIYAPNLGLSLPDQPFGKDVANRGLYTALASHGAFEQISFARQISQLKHPSRGVWGRSWYFSS